MRNDNKLLAGTWIGKEKELRKSYRRKTIAPVSFLDHFPEGSKFLPDTESYAFDLSLDGAFIKNGKVPPIGSIVNLKIFLPSGKRNAAKIGGRVTRTQGSGFGIEFNELHYRDRSRIRNYVGFAELDDTVVSIQNNLKNSLTGNMLPVTDPVVIQERLDTARTKKLNCLILDSKNGKPFSGKIDFSEQGIVLNDLEKKLHPKTRVIYVIIIDGPLHAIFEGLIHDPGHCPKLFYPERIYLNDRRWSRRVLSEQEQLVLDAPHLACPQLKFSVVEKSEGGCSILAPKNCLYTVGMRFPDFELKRADSSDHFEGATISRIMDIDSKHWLLGLHYFDKIRNRDTFDLVSKKSLRSNVFTSVKRFSSLAFQKMKGAVAGRKILHQDRPYVVQYKNTRGETVAALLDATFDLHADTPSVDVAVVIAPPFPVRKEVFGLLARTLVNNFRHYGKTAVVLRFDLTHCLGESEVDPEMAAKGHPYLKWNYSNLVSDMSGTLSFLEKRFTPDKRVMISYSLSAIPARRVIADQNTPTVDYWVAPFGCSDGQDMLQNLLAGVDLYAAYLRGEKIEPFLAYGRLFDPSESIPDAIKNKMGFLEDARNDLSKIKIPITWIIGTYDYMVTRGRVKEIMNAPGGGEREIIELATGHNPRTGAEAIELFKLIYESISKYLFNISVQAIEPDLVRYERQNQAEWARTRKNKTRDMKKFWEDHLFGTSSEKEGYDVLLYAPDYNEFIEKQVELLDIKPDLRVADVGCGTGNLSAVILKKLSNPGKKFELSCHDLIPAAVEKTQKKLEKIIENSPIINFETVKINYRTLDLETARLLCLKEFLEGKEYGIKALNGRIEGLNASTLRKLANTYNEKIHDVIHGEKVSVKKVMELSPEMDESEAEEILELSMASRFLKDKTLPGDLISSGHCNTAADLCFRYLTFGKATRKAQIDCPSDSFDRIGASLVIPYLFEPESVIKEFYRILDKQGILVLSSLKPNAENSKFYFDEAEAIAKREDLNVKERERLLESLREFAAFLSRLVELEDEGRFHFFSADELINLIKKAGFLKIHSIESLGHPPSAVIIRAEKL
ncbi:PilZ domain-containing protein [Desulfobacula sp.]|uniref:PilZ domain-containing protein n=1 Tax=Desulfobacula sp. TaxID=2593537 RepID=UPI002632D85C|nr:PilZ domain-containing protein [Desulfobacula sp.]